MLIKTKTGFRLRPGQHITKSDKHNEKKFYEILNFVKPSTTCLEWEQKQILILYIARSVKN